MQYLDVISKTTEWSLFVSKANHCTTWEQSWPLPLTCHSDLKMYLSSFLALDGKGITIPLTCHSDSKMYLSSFLALDGKGIRHSCTWWGVVSPCSPPACQLTTPPAGLLYTSSSQSENAAWPAAWPEHMLEIHTLWPQPYSTPGTIHLPKLS